MFISLVSTALYPLLSPVPGSGLTFPVIKISEIKNHVEAGSQPGNRDFLTASTRSLLSKLYFSI
jgi:hypothetical protein